MINLVNKSEYWIVTHIVNREIFHERCKTIEIAADFMETLGIRDEEIDYALCQMVGYNHNRAVFDNKGFSHTEDT